MIMMLHHYTWGDIDIDIVEEIAPHFLIAKHYPKNCLQVLTPYANRI